MAPALWLFAVRVLCEMVAVAGDSNPSTTAAIENNSVVATNSAWAQISHISCVSPHDLEFGDGFRAHCHWTVRERVGREAKACVPAPEINTTEQLSPGERDVYGWTPPDLNESVLQVPCRPRPRRCASPVCARMHVHLRAVLWPIGPIGPPLRNDNAMHVMCALPAGA
jgi:hypothetical protein